MSKKKNTETETVGQDIHISEFQINEAGEAAMIVAEKWQMIELKTNMLTMAKEILERNAALQWEQDKTTGLSVTHKDIIKVAKDILKFVVE